MATNCVEYVGEAGAVYVTNQEELGSGCFGQVVLGARKSDGLQVAIKRMESPSPMQLRCAATEREVMKTLQQAGGHENLMALVDLVTEAGTAGVLQIVAESLDCDMMRWLLRVSTVLDNDAKLEIARQFYSGLAFMHGHAMVHGDIHTGNILVAKRQGSIKIGDFGNSEVQKASSLDAGRILDLRDGATDVAAPLWLRRIFCRGAERKLALDGFREAFGDHTPEVVDCVFNRYRLLENHQRSPNWWAEADPQVCGAIRDVSNWNLQTPDAAGVPVPEDVMVILTLSTSLAPYEEVTAENISARFEQIVPQAARDSARDLIRKA